MSSPIFEVAKDLNPNVMNKPQPNLFQWCSDGTNGTHNPTELELAQIRYWVFGYRIGLDSAEHKVSVIFHLDTVLASDGEGWTSTGNPFSPEVQIRDYPGGAVTPQDFLVGRGFVDDQGPAVSAFIIFRALAQTYDTAEPNPFEKTKPEIIFDTSEEWDMYTPVYMKNPVFDISSMDVSADVPLYASAMYTSRNNPCNTIPGWAKVEVTGKPAALADFDEKVYGIFSHSAFDDPEYNRGELDVDTETDASRTIMKVILNINVKGAQHGSAPDQNGIEGWNPLVSLANFVAGLRDEGTLGVNSVTLMAKFIQWTWGKYAFGEKYESLYKYDDVFQKDNGTRYGVAKSTMNEGSIKLEIDIRYALPHHSEAWDGYTEGELDSDSDFNNVFTDLLDVFHKSHPQLGNVSFSTKTFFGPDIRYDTNESYLKAERAFEKVMQMPPPRLAIGGDTDAKGNLSLLAMGLLFDTKLGSPINYHGVSEGAPIIDMQTSTQIIYNLFESELLNPSDAALDKMARLKKDARALAALKNITARGHKYCCAR